MSERTIGERNSTLVFGELGVPALGDDAFSVEILHQLRETLQFQISQDIANGLGLRLVDDQLLILRIVTERHRATGPFALAPAGSDLVADALGARSNRAKDNSTFSVNRPMEVVVLNWWVTATNEIDFASKASTSLAKSASDGSVGRSCRPQ
jgi:hypothetical protein